MNFSVDARIHSIPDMEPDFFNAYSMSMLNELDKYDKYTGVNPVDIRFQGTKLFGFHVEDLADGVNVSVQVFIPQQKRWTSASVKRTDVTATSILEHTIDKLLETYIKYKLEVNDPVFWVQQVLKKDVERIKQGLQVTTG